MRKVYFVVILSICSSLTNAQFTKKVLYRPFYYVSVRTGTNVFVAEGFSDYSMTKALGFNGTLSAGYNFTPVIGLRGNVGLSTHSWPDKSDNFNVKSFLATNFTADLTINATNLMGGYDNQRMYDLSLFGGAGVGLRSKLVTSFLMTPVARGGLQADFRLNTEWSFNLLAEVNMVTDNYNDFIGTKIPFDLYPALNVGFTYRFPTNEFYLHSERKNY
jgi:hypothetical protein